MAAFAAAVNTSTLKVVRGVLLSRPGAGGEERARSTQLLQELVRQLPSEQFRTCLSQARPRRRGRRRCASRASAAHRRAAAEHAVPACRMHAPSLPTACLLSFGDGNSGAGSPRRAWRQRLPPPTSRTRPSPPDAHAAERRAGGMAHAGEATKLGLDAPARALARC